MPKETRNREESFPSNEGSPRKRQKIDRGDQQLTSSSSSTNQYDASRAAPTGIGGRYGEGSTNFQKSPVGHLAEMGRQIFTTKNLRAKEMQSTLDTTDMHSRDHNIDQQYKLRQTLTDNFIDTLEYNDARTLGDYFTDRMNTDSSKKARKIIRDIQFLRHDTLMDKNVYSRALNINIRNKEIITKETITNRFTDLTDYLRNHNHPQHIEELCNKYKLLADCFGTDDTRNHPTDYAQAGIDPPALIAEHTQPHQREQQDPFHINNLVRTRAIDLGMSPDAQQGGNPQDQAYYNQAYHELSKHDKEEYDQERERYWQQLSLSNDTRNHPTDYAQAGIDPPTLLAEHTQPHQREQQDPFHINNLVRTRAIDLGMSPDAQQGGNPQDQAYYNQAYHELSKHDKEEYDQERERYWQQLSLSNDIPRQSPDISPEQLQPQASTSRAETFSFGDKGKGRTTEADPVLEQIIDQEATSVADPPLDSNTARSHKEETTETRPYSGSQKASLEINT